MTADGQRIIGVDLESLFAAEITMVSPDSNRRTAAGPRSLREASRCFGPAARWGRHKLILDITNRPRPSSDRTQRAALRSSRVKEAVMINDPNAVALAYIEGCARKDFDRVAELLAPDIRFEGPGNTVTGAAPYLAVLRRIGTVWVRSDVRRVFVDGSDVCVIYDLVTDTAAGAVPTVEWLRIDGGRVASVHLFFDRVSFKPASEEVARRVAK